MVLVILQRQIIHILQNHILVIHYWIIIIYYQLNVSREILVLQNL